MPMQDSDNCLRLENVMVGRKRNKGIFKKRQSGSSHLPEARVVIDRRPPDWASEPLVPAPQMSEVTYVRMSPGISTTLLAVLQGFWPVVVIVSMGLALLWTGALANSP